MGGSGASFSWTGSGLMWIREDAFDTAIATAAIRWRVPVPLVKATVGIESGFDPAAINRNDPGWAWGLMQMIPTTAQALGYRGEMRALLTDTATAIDLGTKLLGQNLRQAGGVVADSVSAYNGGFRSWLGFGKVRADGTYANQAYVDRVLAAMRYFESQAGATPGPTPGGGGGALAGTSFPPDSAGGRVGVDAARPDATTVVSTTRFPALASVAGLGLWGALALMWKGCLR